MSEQGKNSYLAIGGKKYGPLSEVDIKKLYDAKKINGDTKFARIGDKQWIPLSQSGIIQTTPPVTEDDLPPLPAEDNTDGTEKKKPAQKSKLGYIVGGLAILVVISVIGLVLMILSINKEPTGQGNNSIAQKDDTERPSDTYEEAIVPSSETKEIEKREEGGAAEDNKEAFIMSAPEFRIQWFFDDGRRINRIYYKFVIENNSGISSDYLSHVELKVYDKDGVLLDTGSSVIKGDFQDGDKVRVDSNADISGLETAVRGEFIIRHDMKDYQSEKWQLIFDGDYIILADDGAIANEDTSLSNQGVAYKNIPVSNLLGSVEEVLELLGPEGYDEGKLYYDDIEFYHSDGYITSLEGYDRGMFKIDGVPLNKTLAELIDFLGNPDSQEKELARNHWIYQGNYSITIEAGGSDTTGRIWISRYKAPSVAENTQNLKDEIIGKWVYYDKTAPSGGNPGITIRVYIEFTKDGTYSTEMHSSSLTDTVYVSENYEISGNTLTVIEKSSGKKTVTENVHITDGLLYLGDDATQGFQRDVPLKDMIIGKWKWAAMDSYWEFREDGTLVNTGEYSGVITGRYTISGNTITATIEGKSFPLKDVGIFGNELYLGNAPLPSLIRDTSGAN